LPRDKGFMASDQSNEGLMERGVSAAVWSAFGALVRIGLQIVAQVAMARMLGPETYGLFAISLTIVLFASMFSDLGLSYGLIQRKTVAETDIRFVFTWQVLLGGVLTVFLYLLAAPVARWFAEPRLEAVMQVLSLSCTFVSIGSTSSMLLRRNLDFKSLNVAVVISFAIGFLVVGLGLAANGYGVWSLVAANLTQLGLASLLTYRTVRHSLCPLFVHPEWRGILDFGATVLATNLLNWFMLSLDRLVIGLTMPIAAAGLYATIGNLMMAPVATINGVLQSALYATSVRAQDDHAGLQLALRTVMAIVVLFAAPVFIAIGVTADTMTTALYGDAWRGGGTVLQPIAFAMPAMILMGMAIPTLWASGHMRWEFRLQVPLALLWAVALVGLGWYGSLALLSWAVCLWFYVRASVICIAACYAIKLRPPALLTPMRAGTVVTVLVALTAIAVDHLPIAHPGARALAIILACALSAFASLVAVRSLLSSEVLQLIDKLLQWLPHRQSGSFVRRLLLIPR
jgi:lipopolysaccharide exporter